MPRPWAGRQEDRCAVNLRMPKGAKNHHLFEEIETAQRSHRVKKIAGSSCRTRSESVAIPQPSFPPRAARPVQRRPNVNSHARY
jgi:hypothetical protein